MDSLKQNKIETLIKSELQKSLGCTEPIAIVYAVALATELLEESPTQVDLFLSSNMIKNAMGAAIPYTGGYGVELAALCGVVATKPEAKLEILSTIPKPLIKKAKSLVGTGLIHIYQQKTSHPLYIRVETKSPHHTSKVEIMDDHTYITLKEKNGKVILKQPPLKKKSTSSFKKGDLSYKDIVDYCLEGKTPMEEIFNEAIILAKAICDEGLKNDYGISVGKTLKESVKKGLLNESLENYIISRTASGVDARMDGANFAVMANSGSGNQGITTTMGVVSAAEYLKIQDHSKILKAVALSNATAIFIKKHLPRLSAICGVTIAAMGVSSGLTYLLGGDFNALTFCINNMSGNVTGMFCDGAKPGCASKTATCLSAAVHSAILAINHKGLDNRNGIVNSNVEETIINLSVLANKEKLMDETILDLMIHKK